LTRRVELEVFDAPASNRSPADEDSVMAALTQLRDGGLGVSMATAPTVDANDHGQAVSRDTQPFAIANAALAVKIAVGVVAPLITALAVLGGIGSFATIRRLAVPWFGSEAWIVPVGIDIGILALLAWDLLAEYLSLSWPFLRWTAWAFIATTVYLNIAAAHGDLTAAVMHAAMPVLFVTIIEGIRHLIRQWTGIATGTRIERIPAARWLLAPHSSLQLARHMMLWQVTSYQQGLALAYRRLRAVARLKETYGQFWRFKAPLRDRLALRLALAGIAIGDTDVEQDEDLQLPAAQVPEAQMLSLPRRCLVEPPIVVNPQNKRDRRLIAAASEILRDAEREGARLSQAALARRLRERGHSVANGRLRWLVTSVQRAPASDKAP
jgi:hypothetical protein